MAKRRASWEKLQESYIAALKREMGKAQSTGKLEAVIPFREEITSIQEGKDPLPRLPEGADYQIRKMRSKFTIAKQSILKTHATRLSVLADKMFEVLEKREVAFTKAGAIDQALDAKRMREMCDTDEKIKAARMFLKFAGGLGIAPVAVRLRRAGDNIEVLVRYDSKGKVSMQSPVENLKEKSVEGRDPGDTKAKMLGEFVGAPKFEVDARIGYHQVFDGKELTGCHLTEIVPGFRHREGDRVGVRLALKPKAINPHGSFGARLPPISAKGTYRITCRYFVPKSNRALSGLMFVHDGGGPIMGRRFEKRGEWATEEVVAESAREGQTLLLYLTLAEGKTKADSVNDYVVLGEVEVEFIRFSAYLEQRFNEDDRVVADSVAPKSGLFIINGEFADQ